MKEREGTCTRVPHEPRICDELNCDDKAVLFFFLVPRTKGGIVVVAQRLLGKTLKEQDRTSGPEAELSARPFTRLRVVVYHEAYKPP